MIPQTLQMLIDFTVISSCALLLVLAIRSPLRQPAKDQARPTCSSISGCFCG